MYRRAIATFWGYGEGPDAMGVEEEGRSRNKPLGHRLRCSAVVKKLQQLVISHW